MSNYNLQPYEKSTCVYQPGIVTHSQCIVVPRVFLTPRFDLFHNPPSSLPMQVSLPKHEERSITTVISILLLSVDRIFYPSLTLLNTLLPIETHVQN